MRLIITLMVLLTDIAVHLKSRNETLKTLTIFGSMIMILAFTLVDLFGSFMVLFPHSHEELAIANSVHKVLGGFLLIL